MNFIFSNYLFVFSRKLFLRNDNDAYRSPRPSRSAANEFMSNKLEMSK